MSFQEIEPMMNNRAGLNCKAVCPFKEQLVFQASLENVEAKRMWKQGAGLVS
jgi:hypothetical protein